MRRGFDVSNWTGAPTSAWDALSAGGPGVLFVQAINPPAGYPPGCTVDQVQWGLDNGWDVVAYVWKWFGLGPDDIRRRVDLVAPFTGQLAGLAQDVEDTSVGVLTAAGQVAPLPLPAQHFERFKRQPPPIERPTLRAAGTLQMGLQQRLDELQAAYEILDAFPTTCGLLSAHYTGRWYHLPYLANTPLFARQGRGLWAAQYDGVYDLAVLQLFGEWAPETVIAKQPAGSVTVGRVGNVDPDVIADGVFVAPALSDPAWVAKKPTVVKLAGELLAVADQLDQAAELPSVVHDLAGGVRDRAGRILA